LLHRSDEFEGQGQTSKVKVTKDKKTAFYGPFGGLRVVYVHVFRVNLAQIRSAVPDILEILSEFRRGKKIKEDRR